VSVRVCLAAAFLVHAVCIQAADQSSLPWKLTVGEYFYSNYSGTDLNLRWRADDSSAWVAAYSDRVFGTQARAGADTSINVGQYVQVQPSLQAASMGFLGGSLNVQAGATWYGLVGFGRTDARPYFNLNFDPNDALTFGAGYRVEKGVSYLVFLVADDRFHTGQRDWHANVQIPFGDAHATLDLLRKSGLTDAGAITGWGFSANWDWPRWFLRLAYDPHQNFSAQDAWRLATGIRF
jgi:hypothetical protein